MLKFKNKRLNAIFFTINYSSTFPVRTVCKSCGDSYKYYCFTMHHFFYKNPYEIIKEFKLFSKYLKFNDYFMGAEPSSFTTVENFGFRIDFNHYDPRLHIVNKNNFNKFDSSVIRNSIIVYCKCGLGCWAISANNNAPENINRLCKHKYNVKVDFGKRR